MRIGPATTDNPTDLDGTVVVIEHPRPWANDPLDTPTLPSAVRARLRALADSGVRVALAQKPNGEPVPTLLCSVPDHGGLVLQRRLDNLDEVAGLDLETVLRQAIGSHTVPPGYSEAEPQFLVSAHPTQPLQDGGVAAAMMLLDPDNVWETSDLAQRPQDVSVVVLPSGQLSTGVLLADARPLVDAGWQNRVLVERFAGRVQDDAAIRLAETSLRRHLGAAADAAVEPISAALEPIGVRTIETAEGGSATVTRVRTTWRILPNLIADSAWSGLRPEPPGEPSCTWRCVVDQTVTVVGATCEEHLSVVEVVDELAPGDGVYDWDATHQAAQPAQLPHPAVVSAVAGLTPGSALDLGCGTGRHALWLAENGWQVTGLDFSRAGLRRMAEDAALRQVEVRAELADLRLWTPGGTTFDLILVSHVQVEDVFQRTSPWLSPNGRIVVIGPAPGSPTAGQATTIDHVHAAARATGAQLRVLRAGEIEHSVADQVQRDVVVVAVRPKGLRA